MATSFILLLLLFGNMNVFESCLHRCHYRNYYECYAVNAENFLQRKITKYSKKKLFLKRTTSSIIVNKKCFFQTLSKRSFHKIKFLKRTSIKTFQIIRPYFSLCSKMPNICKMRSKHLSSFFSTFLPTSRTIYLGGTDYLSSTVCLCYVVFETVRHIGRRLPFLKKGLEASPTSSLTPESSLANISKSNSEVCDKEEICTVSVSQQSAGKMHCKSLIPGYMKSPNKRLKTSFNTKLPEDSDSSISERELDHLSRKKSKRSSISGSNINNVAKQEEIWKPSHKSEFRHSSDKTRPNYFVAVQISNPKIHENIQEIQQHILTQDSNFNEYMIPTPTLHITLMVMNISDKETYKRAMQALSNFHKNHNEIMCKNPLILEFCGLSHFHNRVVFGKIKEDESYTRLCQIADSVEKHFAEVDIFTTDEKRDFNPHLTIAKLKFSNRSRSGPKKIHSSLYSKFVNNHLGIETIRSIQLLRMDGPKDLSGYYTGDELLFQLPQASFARMPNITEKKKEIREKTAKTTMKALKQRPSKDNTTD